METICELREALRARLKDSDPEKRREALVGLGRRHDEHLKNAVLNELSPMRPDSGAPYQLQNNEYSLLDASDLVFIDAPGTGFGRVEGPNKEQASGEMTRTPTHSTASSVDF
jgi:hypothetical protein